MKSCLLMPSRWISLSTILFPLFILAVTTGCDGEGHKSGAAPSTGAAAGVPALCRHEVAEKFCPICHPEVKNHPNILLCKEHRGIPEDICTACHPELKAKYKTCVHELPPAFCPTCLAAKKE